MTATNTATEGQSRKLAALALLESRREVFVRRGRRALLKAALLAGSAMADDVRDAVTLPRDIDPVCLGAVPGPLARAGIIGRDGFAQTTRAAGHARPVTVWALRDRSAALRWLSAHPDLPDPDHADDPTPDGAGPTLYA